MKRRNLTITTYPLLSRCSQTCQTSSHHPPPVSSPFLFHLSAKQRHGCLISLMCGRNKGSSAIASPFMCSLLQETFHSSAVVVYHVYVSMQGRKKVLLFIAHLRQRCWQFSPMYADADSYYVYLFYFHPSQHKETNLLKDQSLIFSLSRAWAIISLIIQNPSSAQCRPSTKKL